MSSRYLIPLAVAAALATPARGAGRTGRLAVPRRYVAGQPGQGQTSNLGMATSSSTTTFRRPSTSAISSRDHISTELLAAWPFTHGIDLKTDSGGKDARRLRRPSAADAEPQLALQPGRHVPPVHRRGRQLHAVLGRGRRAARSVARRARARRLVRRGRPGRCRHRPGQLVLQRERPLHPDRVGRDAGRRRHRHDRRQPVGVRCAHRLQVRQAGPGAGRGSGAGRRAAAAAASAAAARPGRRRRRRRDGRPRQVPGHAGRHEGRQGRLPARADAQAPVRLRQRRAAPRVDHGTRARREVHGRRAVRRGDGRRPHGQRRWRRLQPGPLRPSRQGRVRLPVEPRRRPGPREVRRQGRDRADRGQQRRPKVARRTVASC